MASEFKFVAFRNVPTDQLGFSTPEFSTSGYMYYSASTKAVSGSHGQHRLTLQVSYDPMDDLSPEWQDTSLVIIKIGNSSWDVTDGIPGIVPRCRFTVTTDENNASLTDVLIYMR